MCWLSRENEVEEVKNEGPKEMTLDEWKAMQDKERTKVEFNIRKPNEGADSQWKKGYVLHKSKSEDVSVLIYDVTDNRNFSSLQHSRSVYTSSVPAPVSLPSHVSPWLVNFLFSLRLFVFKCVNLPFDLDF